MATSNNHGEHAHMAHLDLMPVDANGTATTATHVAVNNGDWFDPATWAHGQVPGDGALVHIPKDVSVSYEGASDAKLFIVRVDGHLNMHAGNGAQTKMVVDTIVTSTGSSLKIDARGATDGTVDVVFAEGAPAAHHWSYMDHSGGDGVIGRHTWDPDQLSLGLVASGEVEIKGQDIAASLQLATGPAEGATELVFDGAGDPGWQAGQKIVIGGTSYLGRDADAALMTEDEVRTIVDVREVGGRMIVTLDRPLDHDHRGPIDPTTGGELTGYVGNLTRNVTFSSAAADPDGDGIAGRGVSLTEAKGFGEHYVTERGHIMFMHNDDVSVVDAAFLGLGRTDKSRDIDDLVTEPERDRWVLEDNGTPGQYDPETDTPLENAAHAVTNMRGRYALHIHEANEAHHHHGDDDCQPEGVIGPCPDTGGPICHCGKPDRDQDGDGIPNAEDADHFHGAWLEGNVVWGTPGWGIVQHSSDAVIKENVVYDAKGAAFVAELGDEAGRWEGNLAVGTFGGVEKSDNQDDNNFNEDDGNSGVGYYVKARAIDMIDNVAHSSARAGFFYHNAGAGAKPVPAGSVPDDLAALVIGREALNVEDLPMRVFDGNEVIAARQGIRIMTDSHDAVRKFNDAWSHMTNFTAWEIDEAGVSITYSSKYLFENFLVLGTETKVTDDAKASSAGIYFKVSAADITVLSSHIESFDHAVATWTQFGNRQEYRRGYWDPKAPSPYHPSERYEGMGHVDGIDNAAHNLWNINVIGLTYDDIKWKAVRAPAIDVEVRPGVTVKQQGVQIWNSLTETRSDHGVEIELLGDSRDGALVALWREDIANNPDQAAMLARHIPLAYQDTVHPGQIFLNGIGRITREHYGDYQHGINADIWSGTVLEFAKTDSLGRHVFLYGDFAPLDPDSAERAVTTNERLVITREMVDGVLVRDGYRTVEGLPDVKFVIVEQLFTDRATGALTKKKFLIALDLAWEMPEGVKNAGLLLIDGDLIVADQYRLFQDGVLVEGRKPIVLGDRPPAGVGQFDSGRFATDAADDLAFGAASDTVDAGGGDDVLRGFAAADYLTGGAGNDALFGGDGWDRLSGGDGDDLLDGHYLRDFLYGGEGQDRLQGKIGRDDLYGGGGHDILVGGAGNDRLWGEAGDDELDGGNQGDTLDGGDGDDRLSGGIGFDDLYGGAGADVLAGNAGNDRLFGGDGADLMNGGARADQLYGGDGDDQLFGDAGADRLYGEAGDDLLEGQLGLDQLYGGDGQDILAGGGAKDRLYGGAGDDRLAGERGNDRLEGGSGADRFVFDAASDNDVITDFEDGVDAIEFLIESFGFDDLEILRQGDDTVITHQGGTIRLVDIDPGQIDRSDFLFDAPG